MDRNLRQIGFLTSKVHFVYQILYYSISVDFGLFFEAFPDSHTTIERMIAEDNLVMAFLNTTATQTGE